MAELIPDVRELYAMGPDGEPAHLVERTVLHHSPELPRIAPVKITQAALITLESPQGEQ